MDTKKFLTVLSDKFIFLVFIMVVLNLSYLVCSTNAKLNGTQLELRNTQSELWLLNSNLSSVELDLSHIGTRIPHDLLALIKGKSAVKDNPQTKYFILYFISLDACSPCIEEDINLFRKLVQVNKNTLVVFIVGTQDYREIRSVKQKYFIDFPSHFVTYDLKKLNLSVEPTTLLSSKEGKILLLYTPGPNDARRNKLNRKILQQFLSS